MQWQGGPNANQMLPQGPQGQVQVQGTPQQRSAAMPPPSAPAANNANSRNATSSPQVSTAAPPTPSQTTKAAPKKQEKKGSKAKVNSPYSLFTVVHISALFSRGGFSCLLPSPDITGRCPKEVQCESQRRSDACFGTRSRGRGGRAGHTYHSSCSRLVQQARSERGRCPYGSQWAACCTSTASCSCCRRGSCARSASSRHRCGLRWY